MKPLASILSGTLVGHLALAISIPLSAILYTPEDFGLFSIFLMPIGIHVVVGCLTLEHALPQAKSHDTQRLAWLCILFGSTASVLVGVLLYTLQKCGIGGVERLPAGTPLIAVTTCFFASATSVVRGLLLQTQDYRTVGLISAAQNVIRAIFIVICGYYKLGIYGLMGAEAVCRIFIGIQAFQRLGKLPANLLETLNREIDYIRFGLPSSFLNITVPAMQPYVVSALFGLTHGGQFVMAQQILNAPSALLGRALGDVFQTRYSRASSHHRRALFYQFFRGCALLAVLSILPLGLLAPPYLAGILGEKWAGLGPVLSICCCLAIVKTAILPISRIVFIEKAQRLKLKYDLIATTTAGVIWLLAWTYQFSFEFFLVLIVGFQTGLYCIYGAMLHLISHSTKEL